VDFELSHCRSSLLDFDAKFDMPLKFTRREAVKAMVVAGGSGVLAAGAPAFTRRSAFATSPAVPTIRVDMTPKFELSPYLHMQFMEPLGTTDGSVAAAWDDRRNAWREDVIAETKRLSPAMVRWGGIYADFYRWREGVGPRDKRIPARNLMWGGYESNQVGTVEFLDFCSQVGAEPLICVNFEGDGRENFRNDNGGLRWGDAKEAAEWVAFCNQSGNAERPDGGQPNAARVRYWQVGNETSYDNRGFDRGTAIRKTIEFSQAMKSADSDIKIIAWGDSGWAAEMYDKAGEHVDLLAFHHMFNPDRPGEPVLAGERYRKDPAATWNCLMAAWEIHDRKIREVRDSLGSRNVPLAMTECHFTVPGRNRCDVMSTWATGVAYARVLNNHQRHGDVLKIATAADFCGTRWQVNALMIPVPQGKAYLMPVALVMRLYRAHIGTHAVTASADEGLDVVASRTSETLHLHVVNTSRDRSQKAQLDVSGARVQSSRSFTIVDDPMVEVSELNSEAVMQVAERELSPSESWEFPAASVTAIDVRLAA
jgi:alpha-L-arabinofuranosidase